MADPTSSLRDQGRQALQAGNLDAAVDFLSRAVMASDADTDAKMMLGIAYSMKGLHAQAKRALEGAVAGAPQNPDYRFNLGMVLEKAGDVQGAAQAFRSTLQINPQHPQARAKLQALGPQAGYAPSAAPAVPSAAPPPPAVPPSPSGAFAPPPNSTYGAPPTWAPPPGAPPQAPAPPACGPPPAGGLPGMPPLPMVQPSIGAAPLGGLPPIGQPPIGGSPLGGLPPVGQPPMGQPGMAPPPPIGAAPIGGPPPMGAPIGGPPMGAMPGMVPTQTPEGMVQCPRCGQFTRAGMLCEMCSTPLPPPPRQAAPTGPAAFGSTGPVPGYVAAPPADNFDTREGFAQWGGVLLNPKNLFAEQAGRQGFKEPGAFVASWCLIHYGISFVFNLAHGFNGASIGPFMCGFSCGGIMTWLTIMGILFMWAGMLHGTSRMFGGKASFAESFRVTAFGAGPLLLAMTLGMAVVSLMTPSPDALRKSSRTMEVPARSWAGQPTIDTASAPLTLAQFNPSGPPGFPSTRPAPYGVPPGASSGGAANRTAGREALKQVWQGIQTAMVPATIIVCMGFLWATILHIIGIGEVHEVGTGSAVGAALIPALIMGVIFGGLGYAAWNAFSGFMNQVVSGGFGAPGTRRY